jgi:hypothetical protein
MIRGLTSGVYQALVLEETWVDYTALNHPGCQLQSVGSTFATFSQALAFPADFDDTAIQAWSRCSTAARSVTLSCILRCGLLGIARSIHPAAAAAAVCKNASNCKCDSHPNDQPSSCAEPLQTPLDSGTLTIAAMQGYRSAAARVCSSGQAAQHMDDQCRQRQLPAQHLERQFR